MNKLLTIKNKLVMYGINKVILVGNCSEVKVQNNLVTFGLATNQVFKDKNGNKITYTEWHNVKVFMELAEAISNILTKGSVVYVEGYIKTEEYDGKKYVNIIAERINILQFAEQQNLPPTKKILTQNEPNEPTYNEYEKSFEDYLPF